MMPLALAAAGVAVIWLAAVVLRRHELMAHWREPVLRVPVLAVESDDWGPGPPEEAEDLMRLAKALSGVRDALGRPAVMSLGVELERPVGGGRGGWRRLRDARFRALVAAMLRGRDAGVFALQLHCLCHFNAGAVDEAAHHDPLVASWLAQPDPDPWDLPPRLQTRWVRCDRAPSQALAEDEVRQMAHAEVAEFRRCFGCKPTVAVPPTFVWSAEVERAWAAAGVQVVVTPGQRHEGRDAAGNPLPGPRIASGARGPDGVTYLVRDVYFEPFRGHQPAQALEQVLLRVREGRPALIESHRINYVGAGAEHHVALLVELLERVRRRLPAIRFLPPEALAEAYSAPGKSGLFETGLRRRIAAWLARLERDPVLRPLFGPAPLARRLLAGLRWLAAGQAPLTAER